MQAVNTKELTILGKALKALLKAGLIEDVTEIVEYMADDGKESKDDK